MPSSVRSAARRFLVFAASLFAVFVGITCTDATGPSTGYRALIGFASAFSRAATEVLASLEAFSLSIDNVHVRLLHADGSVAADTVVQLAGQDSLEISIAVKLAGQQETLKEELELRDGTTVLFSGNQNVSAIAGLPGTPPPPVLVEYTGPGASATTLDFAPADTTILSTDSIALRPIAKDANGQTVANLALVWSVKDASIGSVNASGVFKPSGARGQTYVVGRIPTGLKDSAFLHVTLPATKAVLVSGGNQTGTVGQNLTQPIVVELQASDNVPVPGAAAAVAVTAGGGSVASPNVVADANGRAFVTLKLGTTVGTNAVQISGAGITPLSVSATGAAGSAKQLSITQQPSATAASGAPLATQPKVQLLDAFGNAVAAANVILHAALTNAAAGQTLGGTVDINTDATGVAAFTNLKVSGPAGTTKLSFAQDTLTGATSNDVAVAVGPAASLTLEGSNSLTVTSGQNLASPPSIFVSDLGGNGIQGVGVRFVVTIAALTVKDTTINTGADGRISLNQLSTSPTAGTYTIAVSSGTLTGSPLSISLHVVASTPAVLINATPLAIADSAGANVASAKVPSVIVLDAFNNPLSGIPVKFRRHGGANSSLNSLPDTMVTLTTGQDGKATLSARRLQTVVGFDTVLVNVSGVSDTLKYVATVTNATPTHLFWINQPLTSTGGAPIPVNVGVRDQYDNFASSASGTMVLAIKSGTGTAGAVLSPPGEVSKSFPAGVSTHSVAIDKTGTAYVMTATSGTLGTIESAPFNINLGTLALLQIVSGDGQGALTNDSLPDSLVVRATDAGGNALSGVAVSFTIDSGGAGAIAYTPSFTTSTNGRAATTWRVGVSGQPQVLRASANAGAIFTKLHAFMAETTAVVTQPSTSPQNGVTFPQQPKVQLRDRQGHQVKRSGIDLAAYPTFNPSGPDASLFGTTTKTTDANGEATYTDLGLTGTIQTLKLDFVRLVLSIVDTSQIRVGESAPLNLVAGVAAGVYQADTLFHVYSSAGSASLQVRVTDGSFNVVQSASVTFSFDANAGCSLGSTTATSDITGIAAVTLTHPAAYGSCVVRARLTNPPPPPPCVGECFYIGDHQVSDRTFVAPTGTKVWLGGWGYNFWGDGPNWSGGSAPGQNDDVYISQAAPAWPYIYDFANGFKGNGTARSIKADRGIRLETNSDYDTLRVYGSFDVDTVTGNGYVWLAPDGNTVGGTARGYVAGTLRIGIDTLSGNCPTSSTAYSLSDSLSATTVQVYCKVDVNSKTLGVGYGGLTTKRAGGIVMTHAADTLHVLGDAVFAGTGSTFSAGQARFMGNFTQIGDATVVTYNASSAHESLFAGEGQSQSITMSDPSVNKFGKLTSGNVDYDVTINPLTEVSQTIVASGGLELKPNAKFTLGPYLIFAPSLVLGSGSMLTVNGVMSGVTSCTNNGATITGTGSLPTICTP